VAHHSGGMEEEVVVVLLVVEHRPVEVGAAVVEDEMAAEVVNSMVEMAEMNEEQ